MIEPSASSLQAVHQKCYHCGELCEREMICHEGKDFCCPGCKSVFQLLSSCQLDGYYRYAENPGIRQLKAPSRDAFAYLDDDGIQEKLLSYRSASLAKVEFRLPAMHCASCIWLIENFRKLVPGVISSRVNFTKRTAAFDYDPRTLSLRRLVEQLAAIGYEPELRLENTARRSANPYTRRLILQMGVAGFCFGNIMLLSLPEYLAGQGTPGLAYRNFFGYINFTLGLPVLLFSAVDYLRSARDAIKMKRVNMDVPIALGILALFARSTYEIFALGGGGYMDSLAALIFFLLIGKWIQQRTYDSLSFERDYKSYFPIAVQRLTGADEIPCGIDALKPGDRYRLRSGELIPADSIVVNGVGAVDYSFVSGESEPVDAHPGARVFAGGRQVGQSVVLEVLKTVNQSYLTGLWNGNDQNTSHRLEEFADRVGRRFTYAVLAISAGAAAYWMAVDPAVAWNAVSAVLIVACPCALALSFPFAFANAVRFLGRKGLYLKNASALGRMAEVTDIVFDKTGTLTHSDNARTAWQGPALSVADSDVVFSMSSQSGHPLSRFIARKLAQSATSVPLDSFREVAGEGIEATAGKALYRLGSARFAGAATSLENTLASDIYLSVDGLPRGKFTVQKSYRPALHSLTASLKQQHCLHLLSGDNDAEKQNIEDLFGQTANLHFNQSPFDKERYVNYIQSGGAVVAMIGDGLNDAGALRAADVGISVADDVFRFAPASDAILSASSFHILPSFFKYAQGTLRLVKMSFVLSFIYNGTGVFFAVRGALEPVIAAVLMPLSSVTVVGFVTLGTAMLYRRHLNKTDKSHVLN